MEIELVGIQFFQSYVGEIKNIFLQYYNSMNSFWKEEWIYIFYNQNGMFFFPMMSIIEPLITFNTFWY